jgi:hypothetical protein
MQKSNYNVQEILNGIMPSKEEAGNYSPFEIASKSVKIKKPTYG